MTTSPTWQDRFTGVRWAEAFGKSVRVLSVAKSGVRCRFPDGHVERLHPDDLTTPQEAARTLAAS